MLQGVYKLLRRGRLRRGPRRIVGGVCHGIARRIGCDPGLVRLVTLVAFLLPFVGWGLYLLAWLVIPYRDGSILLERLFSGFDGRGGAGRGMR